MVAFCQCFRISYIYTYLFLRMRIVYQHGCYDTKITLRRCEWPNLS